MRRLELNDRLPNDVKDNAIMDVSAYAAARRNVPSIWKETTVVVCNVSGKDLGNVTHTVIA
jgi:hypothetical protein